jgi:hypothetical protein
MDAATAITYYESPEIQTINSRMTAPRVITIREIVTFTAKIIGWIVGLSLLLHHCYGARPTGGWLVVGVMISGVVYGGYLMTRDLFSTVEKSEPGSWTFSRKWKPEPAKSGEVPKKHLRDRRLAARSYRMVFSLEEKPLADNRRKGGLPGRRQSGFRPVMVRFNPV